MHAVTLTPAPPVDQPLASTADHEDLWVHTEEHGTESFADAVRRRVEEVDISRTRIAANAGVHPNTLYLVTSGKRRRPSDPVAMALANALDIPLPDLAIATGRNLTAVPHDGTCIAPGCEATVDSPSLCGLCDAMQAFGPLPVPERPETIVDDWAADAACAKAGDPDAWHTDRPSPYARRNCAACPVRPECFWSAITAGETSGMWGGRDFTPSNREIPSTVRNTTKAA